MKVFGLKLRPMVPVVVFCCFVCMGSQSLHAQQTISFPNFNSTAGLRINGNAAVVKNSRDCGRCCCIMAASLYRGRPIRLQRLRACRRTPAFCIPRSSGASRA